MGGGLANVCLDCLGPGETFPRHHVGFCWRISSSIREEWGV